MECAVVCAAGGFAFADVAAVAVVAFAFALVAAAVVAVASALLGYAWALLLAVVVANVAAVWLLARVFKHGPTAEVFRRHRRAAARPRTALPRGTRLAITDGRERALEGVVLDTGVKEARHGRQ